ncbi:NUDIX hydrolase [Sediminihaliea albiluteola]|uniref:NUDIX hydrolase n=1 Tax=Sediminihaliea albiluteola TaxID=2758564 RepID=UPI002E2E20C7|nr:CoA pyrophosphatase [Sediminihaliea albiluteola]
MPVSLLHLIEHRLSDHRAGRKRLRRLRQRSAVAIILSVREGELHILMIKRAEREGDPWSGHMAFPGGRMEPDDAHGYAVAHRETEEEIGVHLDDCARCIGRLSDITAGPRGVLGMFISPFVFCLEKPVEFSPNYEVAEVVWVPLEFLMDSSKRETMVWKRRGLSMELPCYIYKGRRIWGLSLMMLDELMDLVEGRNPQRKLWRR